MTAGFYVNFQMAAYCMAGVSRKTSPGRSLTGPTRRERRQSGLRASRLRSLAAHREKQELPQERPSASQSGETPLGNAERMRLSAPMRQSKWRRRQSRGLTEGLVEKWLKADPSFRSAQASGRMEKPDSENHSLEGSFSIHLGRPSKQTQSSTRSLSSLV